MKEMTAVEYLKTKHRILKPDEKGFCSIGCTECPFYCRNNGSGVGCSDFERMHPEKVVAIVQKWGEEHPAKTVLQDFLEKHPDALVDTITGVPFVCADMVGYGEYSGCLKVGSGGCRTCWNRPLEVE